MPSRTTPTSSMEPTDRPEARPEQGSRVTVSVVIPTRNRHASLARALRALARQLRPPDEVVVVDASDSAAREEALRREHPGLPITHLGASPGVCAQRNLGIRRARGSHVLLLDDDIEPSPDYLERLAGYMEAHPAEGAVTGVLREPDADGVFREGFEVPSVRHLLFAFLFQLTVWGDVEAAEGGRLSGPPLALLKRWYRHRGNTWSLAGWPLVTRVGEPAVRTAVYGLGAALVRRDWLLASPYDEGLGTHGIGDNYGVALGFPGEQSVVVLTDLPVTHHRAPDHRLDPGEAWYRRVLALDYFLRTSPRFSPLNVLFLAWSLKGSALRFAARWEGDRLRRALGALSLVVTGRNPLLPGRGVERACPGVIGTASSEGTTGGKPTSGRRGAEVADPERGDTGVAAPGTHDAGPATTEERGSEAATVRKTGPEGTTPEKRHPEADAPEGAARSATPEGNAPEIDARSSTPEESARESRASSSTPEAGAR